MIYDFYINDQLLPESFTCRDCFGDGIFWVATSILLKVFITHLEKVNMYSIGRVHSFGLTYDGTFVNATDIGQHLRSYLKLSLDHQGKCMLLEHVVDFDRNSRHRIFSTGGHSNSVKVPVFDDGDQKTNLSPFVHSVQKI